MPFENESQVVELVPWRPEWEREFRALAEELGRRLAETALAIDHVGSTAIPGMPAKDVIDVQVRVATLDVAGLERTLGAIGFRLRPEPWNRLETLDGEEHPKAVFAPPPGGRPVNVHVRPENAPTARYALLFRDYLRADVAARDSWAAFKRSAAIADSDLAGYGQIKSSAMPELMERAEGWAAETAWTPARGRATPAGS